MDPLISISYVHKQIYELPNVYQKIMEAVNFYNVFEYVKTLNTLFEDTFVPHFDFEEKELFIPALEKEEPAIKKLASELQQEHKQITEKLARVNEVDSKLKLNPNATQKEKEELNALCTEITQDLTNHAQKEDTVFFPFLKNIKLS